MSSKNKKIAIDVMACPTCSAPIASPSETTNYINGHLYECAGCRKVFAWEQAKLAKAQVLVDFNLPVSPYEPNEPILDGSDLGYTKPHSGPRRTIVITEIPDVGIEQIGTEFPGIKPFLDKRF